MRSCGTPSRETLRYPLRHLLEASFCVELIVVEPSWFGFARQIYQCNNRPKDRLSHWYPGLESNQHLLLRTELFYPLNYQGLHPL